MYGAEAPPADTWLAVTGTWHPRGTLGTRTAQAALDVRDVRPVAPPVNAYTDDLPLTPSLEPVSPGPGAASPGAAARPGSSGVPRGGADLTEPTQSGLASVRTRASPVQGAPARAWACTTWSRPDASPPRPGRQARPGCGMSDGTRPVRRPRLAADDGRGQSGNQAPAHSGPPARPVRRSGPVRDRRSGRRAVPAYGVWSAVVGSVGPSRRPAPVCGGRPVGPSRRAGSGPHRPRAWSVLAPPSARGRRPAMSARRESARPTAAHRRGPPGVRAPFVTDGRVVGPSRRAGSGLRWSGRWGRPGDRLRSAADDRWGRPSVPDPVRTDHAPGPSWHHPRPAGRRPAVPVSHTGSGPRRTSGGERCRMVS